VTDPNLTELTFCVPPPINGCRIDESQNNIPKTKSKQALIIKPNPEIDSGTTHR